MLSNSNIVRDVGVIADRICPLGVICPIILTEAAFRPSSVEPASSLDFLDTLSTFKVRLKILVFDKDYN